MAHQPHNKYSGDGNGSVINGVFGSNERFGDAEWLGFDSNNFDAIIGFKAVESIQNVKIRCFNGEGQWIYLPKKITLLASKNGIDFKEITSKTPDNNDQKIITTSIDFDTINTRFLKIFIENYGVIPDGKQGGGNPSWLFVDGILVD